MPRLGQYILETEPRGWFAQAKFIKGRTIIIIFVCRGAEGRGGTFSLANTFLYAAPAANIFFFVSVLLQTVFLLAYNLFQCLWPLHTIYFKIFQPPPLPPTNPLKK